jgi:hypothetical protein
VAGLETKVAAGSATFLVAGYIVDLAIALIPWLHQHLAVNDQRELVLIVAWALGSLAAYKAPHTHRPDLQPPSGYQVTLTGPAPGGTPTTVASGRGPRIDEGPLPPPQAQ